MYEVKVRIRGIVPLLQHKFASLDSLMEGATKKTGASDYSLEWMDTMYVSPDGFLFQPAAHIEGALVNAAVLFKVKGRGGKTWKDAVRAYSYVKPEEIIHLCGGEPVCAPGPELLRNPTEHLRVDVRRVKINRAAVARSRLLIAAGWELAFRVEVHDDQVRPDVLRAIANEAGRAVGIGDFRPRYGRFEVVEFEVQQ